MTGILSVDDYLDVAKSYDGYNENDHGGKTKFGIWYGDRHKNSAFDSAAWCDMFASYCAYEAGGEAGLDLVGEYAYTVDHARWFARNGRWGSKPTEGSLGFIDWTCQKDVNLTDHVVIVRGTDSRGRVLTIEGNSGDQVGLHYRDRNLFVGYGYPRFTRESGKAPTTGGDKPAGNIRPAIGVTAPKFPLAADSWYATDSHNGSGSTSDRNNVRRLQTRLKTRGWKISPDGIFGPKTKQIVMAFQDEKRLTVDGAVGRITWAAIWEAPVT